MKKKLIVLIPIPLHTACTTAQTGPTSDDPINGEIFDLMQFYQP